MRLISSPERRTRDPTIGLVNNLSARLMRASDATLIRSIIGFVTLLRMPELQAYTRSRHWELLRRRADKSMLEAVVSYQVNLKPEQLLEMALAPPERLSPQALNVVLAIHEQRESVMPPRHWRRKMPLLIDRPTRLN